jgi:hypothetical protein
MVFFFELAFFVVALAIIAVAEFLDPRVALALALAVLMISALARLQYARVVAAVAPSGEVVPLDRATREEIAFREELLRSWRHFNLLVLLGLAILGLIVLGGMVLRP